MKEAIAWHYQGLFVLGLIGIGWLVALAAVAVKPSRLKTLHRSAIVGVVALSFPAYIAYGIWYSEYSPNSLKGSLRARLALVEEQTALYKKLCSSDHPIVINKVIELPKPTSIGIEEQPEQRLGHALRLTQPWHPATSVCWLNQPSDSCPNSNFDHVVFKQWVYSDLERTCEASPAFRSSAKCVEQTFSYDRVSQTRVRVETSAPQLRYVLVVAEPEAIGPLILRFSISIQDRQTAEVIASTQILKRLVFGDMPRPIADEPPHCPPRDIHVAELLSKVFPAVKNALSR